MKVLIACEFSGTVRDAFIERGHDAISCDLLPSLSDKGRHYQGDVFDIITAERWDLMIAHPPCQYLTTAGNRHFKNNPDRCAKREEAFNFAMRLFNAPIPKICMENPQGWINTHFRKPDQIIHPYFFGDAEVKRTCLWLKNLPKLYWTIPNARKPSPKYYRMTGNAAGKAIYFTEAAGSKKSAGFEQWQLRSKTFQSIADAMADQWGTEKTHYFFEDY